jgi:hypothetical protein
MKFREPERNDMEGRRCLVRNNVPPSVIARESFGSSEPLLSWSPI